MPVDIQASLNLWIRVNHEQHDAVPDHLKIHRSKHVMQLNRMIQLNLEILPLDEIGPNHVIPLNQTKPPNHVIPLNHVMPLISEIWPNHMTLLNQRMQPNHMTLLNQKMQPNHTTLLNQRMQPSVALFVSPMIREIQSNHSRLTIRLIRQRYRVIQQTLWTDDDQPEQNHQNRTFQPEHPNKANESTS